MRVAMTGSGGCIGTALAASLRVDGHEIVRLVRRAAQEPDEAGYVPELDLLNPERLEGCRAIVHLAGADPGAHAWNAADRATFQRSRYEVTRKICQGVAGLRDLPDVFVSASSLAYYGECPAGAVDGASPRGKGALAEFVEEWEFAAEMVEAVGMRLVWARLAPVFPPRRSPTAGLGAALRSLDAAGFDAALGDPQHAVDWVALDDAVAALRHTIETASLDRGVVVCAPQAATREALMRGIGDGAAAPRGRRAGEATDARAHMGDLWAEAWTASRRAEPRALLASGFRFRQPQFPSP